MSKWERGDSIPDVLVLAEIAELFSVSIDYFLHRHDVGEKKPKIEAVKKRTHLAIYFTSCISLYVVAVLLFFILGELYSSPDWLWKLFIIPLPVASVLSIVFCSVWSKNRVLILTSVSALLWTALLTLYVFASDFASPWMLFVIGAPLQVIILFWLLVIHKNKK